MHTGVTAIRNLKKYIFCQCRRRYVYDIISDAAVTSNTLNQQIKRQQLSHKNAIN